MRNRILKNTIIRLRRARHVRSRITGTSTRPRLSVDKSNRHIHVQLIDDVNSRTLGGTSTYSKEFRGTEFGKKSKASARKLGEKIAQIAKENQVTEVIFDRGYFKYHGILAELADAAREAGLKF